MSANLFGLRDEHEVDEEEKERRRQEKLKRKQKKVKKYLINHERNHNYESDSDDDPYAETVGPRQPFSSTNPTFSTNWWLHCA